MRNLRRDKKGGLSVIIAFIMGMTIVFSLVLNIFLWQQQLTDFDNARTRENFEIQNSFFSGSNLEITVLNKGSGIVHLIGLWTNDTRYEINYLVDDNATVSENLGLSSSDSFKILLTSERGNLATSSYTPEPPEQVQALGVFKMSWFYCQYTSSKQTTKADLLALTCYGSSMDKYVVIYLQLTNNWVYPATIKGQSFVTFLIYSTDPEFYVVNSTSITYGSLPKIGTAFDDLTTVIQSQQTVTLAFACQSPNSLTWNWGTSFPSTIQGYGEGANMLISLFYNLDGYSTKTYGQTLTAQAVRLNHG